MHSYTTDAKDREAVPALLAVLAVGTTLLFNYLLEILQLRIPWWIDAPAVMGFYGLFHNLFDNILWRVQLGPVRFSSIPDIRVVWAGKIKSSYNNGVEIPVVFYIRQTWSKLSIQLETDNSRSFSTMAALNTDEATECFLRYEYLNEPAVFGAVSMQSHRGTGHLYISSDNKAMNGDYYTGRGRQNMGTIVLQFISRTLLKREDALDQMSPALHTSI